MQTFLWTTVILVLLIQRSTARLLVSQCANRVVARIVNGKNAEQKAAAWMAGIRNETDLICGGTVIHKRFVLTAAHCIEDQTKLFVMLRAYNISRPGKEYNVSRMIVHSGYSSETLDNDIGLLQLASDIAFSVHIYPICIIIDSSMHRLVENITKFYAYGWGETSEFYSSELLQKVTLDHYNNSKCNSDIPDTSLTSKQICAGSSYRDTCFGDSGGPLIRQLKYNNTSCLTQLGIVSFGNGETCDGLGVYTDVTSYVDWIQHMVNLVPLRDTEQTKQPSIEAVSDCQSLDQVRLLGEPCGSSRSMRIINGEKAEPEAAAWMASIQNEEGFICGGTVIHRRFVLTSAQCIENQDDLVVTLGAFNISNPTEVYNVTKMIIHEEYSGETYQNDIGLLQLSRDVKFGARIHPICIVLSPEIKSKVESSYTFDAYGWGSIEMSDIYISTLLQKGTLDRYDRNECNQIFNISLTEKQICAGAAAVGTCSDDYGGPLTKKVYVNGIQRQTQFGIVSFGTCDRVGVYTDVTSYAHWIERKVKGLRT